MEILLTPCQVDCCCLLNVKSFAILSMPLMSILLAIRSMWQVQLQSLFLDGTLFIITGEDLKQRQTMSLLFIAVAFAFWFLDVVLFLAVLALLEDGLIVELWSGSMLSYMLSLRFVDEFMLDNLKNIKIRKKNIKLTELVEIWNENEKILTEIQFQSLLRWKKLKIIYCKI